MVEDVVVMVEGEDGEPSSSKSSEWLTERSSLSSLLLLLSS